MLDGYGRQQEGSLGTRRTQWLHEAMLYKCLCNSTLPAAIGQPADPTEVDTPHGFMPRAAFGAAPTACPNLRACQEITRTSLNSFVLYWCWCKRPKSSAGFVL